MTLFPATREFFRLTLHSFPAATAVSAEIGSNLTPSRPRGLLEGLVGREVRPDFGPNDVACDESSGIVRGPKGLPRFLTESRICAQDVEQN